LINATGICYHQQCHLSKSALQGCIQLFTNRAACKAVEHSSLTNMSLLLFVQAVLLPFLVDIDRVGDDGAQALRR
jgi:hypothetical protein